MSSNARTRCLDGSLLVALVALGTLLRLPGLQASLWRDEAATYFDATAPSLGASMHEIVRAELGPPAYFLIMRAWLSVSGTNEFALRFPSLIFGLLFIVATYALGRTTFGRTTAAVAAFFAAFSLSAVYLSGDARPYALTGLLSTLAALAYFKMFSSARPVRWAVAFTLAAIALAYTHYTGLILIAGLALGAPYLLWRTGTVQRRALVAGSFVAVAAGFAPWLPTFVLHQRIGIPWYQPIPPGHFYDRFGEEFGYVIPFSRQHGMIEYALVLAFVLGAVRFGYRLRQNRATLSWPSAVPSVIVACLFLGSLVETAQLLREPRYMFVFASLSFVWFGSIVAWLFSGFARSRPSAPSAKYRAAFAGLLALFALVNLAPEFRAYRSFYATIDQSGMRSLVAQMRGHSKGERVLYVAAPDYLAQSLAYYLRDSSDDVVGFARWSQPQHFSCYRYADRWREPGAVATAQRHIEALVPSKYDRIALISDPWAGDIGEMRYSRVKELRAGLERDYTTILESRFDGNHEAVRLTLLAARTTVARSTR